MKKEILILLFILIGAFAVRLYGFNNPMADWHSWRQSDTSSVSRYFVTNGFDILNPRFHDLSKTPSNGIDNPEGYRFVEFPIYNVLQAGGYTLFPIFTLEEWGRLINIIASLFSITLLYLIVRKYSNIRSGLFTAFFFAFIPYNIFFSRVTLPDPLMVTAILGGTYFFDKWVCAKNLHTNNLRSILDFRYIVSLLLITCAFLLRPYAIFFTVPIIYLAYRKWGVSFLRKWQLWIFFLVAIVPFGLWRIWMLRHPEGVPVSNWLFNGNGIRFKGAFFQWIFGDRIPRLISGYWGLPFIVLGVLVKQKDSLFFSSFLLSSLVYLFAVATGNVMHDYYQILIVPTLAIFFGIGVDFILSQSETVFNRRVAKLSVVVCILLMFMLSWYNVRGYYNIDHPEIIEAGKAVDKLAPKDAKVIAAYGGDTTFLYQTKRRGWPVVDRSWEDLIKAGAHYIVLVNPSKEELHIGTEYKQIKYEEFFVQDDKRSYVIFDLTQKLQ